MYLVATFSPQYCTLHIYCLCGDFLARAARSRYLSKLRLEADDPFTVWSIYKFKDNYVSLPTRWVPTHLLHGILLYVYLLAFTNVQLRQEWLHVKYLLLIAYVILPRWWAWKITLGLHTHTFTTYREAQSFETNRKQIYNYNKQDIQNEQQQNASTTTLCRYPDMLSVSDLLNTFISES